ncbi:hypothetical protein [Kitasatospora sp. NPDC057015]|uniref:hypothetical protein n=1 Tax=Kitasatospora sp. NPDC057015 TaxID=3346001 RepID=UPI0036457D7A
MTAEPAGLHRPLRLDLLLTLVVLPMEALLVAGTALLTFALAFGASEGGGGAWVAALLVVGPLLALAPPVLVTVHSRRAGFRVLPVAAALLPVALLLLTSAL